MKKLIYQFSGAFAREQRLNRLVAAGCPLRLAYLAVYGVELGE